MALCLVWTLHLFVRAGWILIWVWSQHFRYPLGLGGHCDGAQDWPNYSTLHYCSRSGDSMVIK